MSVKKSIVIAQSYTGLTDLKNQPSNGLTLWGDESGFFMLWGDFSGYFLLWGDEV